MSTNTVRLHRTLQAKAETIYRAFLDPDAMAKWLPPNGFIGKVHRWMRESTAATGCPSPISRAKLVEAQIGP